MAAFIARGFLGLMMLMAGWWKIFTYGVENHAANLFVGSDVLSNSWIPEWLLYALGIGVPFVELIAGGLILIGLFSRWAIFAIGLLHLITTYGHLLESPFYDFSGHTLVRLLPAIFWLMLPPGSDKLSVDYILSLRRAQDRL